MRIAVDAMGGDFAPGAVVEGALVAARHLDVGLTLVGDATLVRAELARHPGIASLDIEVLDALEAVGMGEAPAALRRKRRSSVRLAAEAVARGDAAAFFSAGNTGATVLAAHAAFGLLSGVDRPALAATIPTAGRPAILLDAGANAECRAQHLVQFALMGAVYATISLRVTRPRVALLSIGEEATKGNELTIEAHRLLKTAPVDFIGNVEARELFAGPADVIVCDGFTGNVALKVSEGLVEVVEELLRNELSRTFSTRVGYLLSRRAFRRFQKRVDYSEYGGAPLVGVDGLCVVGHGRSSAKAVRNAIVMAHTFAEQDLVQSIERELVLAFRGRR